MQCPVCSAPVLLGAPGCSCQALTENSPFELNYWEALRAWWRIYWPSLLLGFVILLAANLLLLSWMRYRRNMEPLRSAIPATMVVIQLLIALFTGAIVLFLFTARLLSRPYRGFSLVTVRDSEASDGMRMTLEERRHVFFFLWWRQLAGGLISMVMALPLNGLLFTMGIRISSDLASIAGLFVIGPILIKMLVGHQFKGFRVEARHAATAL